MTDTMTAERALAVLDELISVPVIECVEDQEFVDEANEARAFFAAMVERTTWQPIETAPKDGTRILLWGRYWSDGQGFFKEPMAGLWNTHSQRWECAWGCWFGVRPTKWMPLPANPEPQP